MSRYPPDPPCTRSHVSRAYELARGSPAMDLQDRHVVVPGAGGGIGAALARRFHAGGARVTLADLGGAEDTAAEIGDRAVGLTADVASEDGNVRLIEQAEAAFGPIDLFFANAGIGGGTDLD